MRLIYLPLLGIALLGTGNLIAQTTGPNLLGAKGTFSAPYVVPNTGASSCTNTGDSSFRPLDNIAKSFNQLDAGGTPIPTSSYTYTSASGGLEPEGTYTLIKNIGDANGRNCIKGDWRGKDHTGDGGWFMAINGATTKSKTNFYSINAIPVCAGTQYEFSAWVTSLLPDTSQFALPEGKPEISFVVKWKIGNKTTSTTIAGSGPIEYTAPNNPVWIKVGGTFTVPNNVSSVDLEVNNANTTKLGNDFGLDDISLNVVQSNITITGTPAPVCEGTTATVNYTVHDASHTNAWYKWQTSTNGGLTYTDSTAPAQAAFIGDSYTLTLNLQNVSITQNGKRYRLVVSTSSAGLSGPSCTFVNDYTLVVAQCGPMPVSLTYFNGRYTNGQVALDWQTQQESNNDRFEVYKSSNGQDFTMIGSVKGAGNSSTVENYSFTDIQTGNSQYVYYRLRQVDIDGKSVNSKIVRVLIGAKASIEVYPNPFSSYFTASFSANKTANATMIIRNSIGQPVMQRTFEAVKGNNSININNLSSLKTGIYFVTISNEDIHYNIKLQKQ